MHGKVRVRVGEGENRGERRVQGLRYGVNVDRGQGGGVTTRSADGNISVLEETHVSPSPVHVA